MDRLSERLRAAHSALSRLEEVLSIDAPSLIERDATIQRFEFTFEALWKAAKEYLFVIEGFEIASPKGVIRSCRELGILNDESATHALVMADDRNLTLHTYNETLANQIYSRIKSYSILIRNWLQQMQDRAN
ncbi:MAG: HI0074 family nucleotidyltransferase substrate-binding subunit [Peptococcaceae bacterium]|nr:HI0074 family nucleotidyltransferase substrate-binding subunit [Peptococcaceae bacterium]